MTAKRKHPKRDDEIIDITPTRVPARSMTTRTKEQRRSVVWKGRAGHEVAE